jgi:hypothetical protein
LQQRITGHKTFAIFQHYNNPTEDELRQVVTTTPPTRQHESVGKRIGPPRGEIS